MRRFLSLVLVTAGTKSGLDTPHMGGQSIRRRTECGGVQEQIDLDIGSNIKRVAPWPHVQSQYAIPHEE